MNRERRACARGSYLLQASEREAAHWPLPAPCKKLNYPWQAQPLHSHEAHVQNSALQSGQWHSLQPQLAILAGAEATAAPQGGTTAAGDLAAA